MSKTRLPDNWKPCEVNQAPNLNQYQINSQCFEMSQEFWSLSLSNEEDAENMAYVGLYKLLPKMFSVYDYNVLPSNWKPCI